MANPYVRIDETSREIQKKSKSGIKTPKEDMALINLRLKAAKQDYEVWQAQQGAR